MKKNSKLSGLYLGILFFLMYLPIGVVVVFSFNEARLPVRFTGFSLKWYQELFQDRDLIQALKNSLILAVSSCGVSAVIGTLGAVGLSRIHWKTKGVMEYISILPLMIPEIILGMVFLSVFSLMGLPFGMVTLVIAHTTFCVPYVFTMVRARLVGMDRSLEEAALDLGASAGLALRKVVIPQLIPGIVSGFMLSVTLSLDDYFITTYTKPSTFDTISTYVVNATKGSHTEIKTALWALSTLIFVVIVAGVLAWNLLADRKAGAENER